MLVQTEIERVKFVVRSYIRTRLYKVSHAHRLREQRYLIHGLYALSQIEKFARWISATPDEHGKLSKAERDHAQR